jgi:hypothetical protein
MLAAQQHLHASVAALAPTGEHLRAAWPTELNPHDSTREEKWLFGFCDSQ